MQKRTAEKLTRELKGLVRYLETKLAAASDSADLGDAELALRDAIASARQAALRMYEASATTNHSHQLAELV